MNSQVRFDTLRGYAQRHSQAHFWMAPDSQGCFATLRYVCTSTIGAEKRLFTIHNKRAFDGCLCWCPVAPMCPDPLQHIPIFNKSYLGIDFHYCCGEAPMHGAQQVQLLMGCLCWCPVAPMCLDPLQAAACIYIHAQTGLYIHIRIGFHCAQHDS